ncbi:transforming growth factor beta activator LRRC32 [Megalops cyprinoides]|uniref:transforming growth factor beta activator LRRC32 n=1 Tax=Megalops cyprinoides TaxID=118141 RepID=UPI001864A21E|nr:transforming growth factor beta activator LRRC32 [Megalops cyprinoides]
MGSYLWFILAFMNEVTATFRPRQLSPCQVVNMDVYCNDLNLRTIPEELPPNIYTLDLSRNLLQNLTQELLAFYTTIHHLNLHSNKIQFIQPGLFKDMTNLQELDLSKNYLDIFAVSKTEVGPLSTVKKLSLSGNGLYTGMTDYFLRDAPSLLNLSLDGNSITKIGKETFSGSLALRNIDLHNNVILEIEEGAFESLLDLSELDLSMNSITCITDFNLSQLKLLNLSKNSLESFQTTDSDLEFELLYLDLRENKIHYFPILPRKNRLIYLDLSRNRMRSVNTTGLSEDLEYISEGRFTTHALSAGKTNRNDFSRLLYLDMSYNQIKSIPASFLRGLGSIEVLNLSNNCLEAFSVDHSGPLNTLKTLDLSFNVLQNLSFGENTLQTLEELYLNGNILGTIDPLTFYRLPRIRDLHLQQNFLSVCGSHHRLPQRGHRSQASDCVFLSSIPTLHYLYLSRNSLDSVPQNAFRGSPLLVLDLSENPGLDIHQNAFSGLESSLTHLSLKENDLGVLKTDLSVLSSLKNVDLSMNRLTTLPLWNKETVIESLNLQNNSLVTLEYSTVLVLEKTLKTLYLGSNPLSCCGNLRFLRMVQKSSVDIPDIASVTCQYTQDSEHKEISIMSVEQEHCDTIDKKSLGIIVIIITALVLIGVLTLLSKMCHPRRRRLRRSFKA